MLKTNLEKGIHGDDADLVNRRNAFGSNTYPRKKGRSFLVHIALILSFGDSASNKFSTCNICYDLISRRNRADIFIRVLYALEVSLGSLP